MFRRRSRCGLDEDDPPVGLRCSDGAVEVASLPEVRVRRARALASAIVKPFDRSAALVFFGAVGLLGVLVFETVAAALVLDQNLVDSFYGAVKTLVTVDPNPAVKDGPDWFKLAISASMLIALLFAAAFTGGLVERLIGRRLTGLLGRRAVPRSDHVVVVGLGQVGLRLALLLRRCGIPVVAIDEHEDGENVGHAKELDLPVVIGRGADPSLLKRLSLEHALALVAVTNDDCRTSPSRWPHARWRRTCGSSYARARAPRRAKRAPSSRSATSATCTESAPSTWPGSRSGPRPRTSSSTARPPTCARRTGRSNAARIRSRADSIRIPSSRSARSGSASTMEIVAPGPAALDGKLLAQSSRTASASPGGEAVARIRWRAPSGPRRGENQVGEPRLTPGVGGC